MRALVEQTARVARQALERLEDPTPVHVLMGGVEPDDWRREPERRAVIIGTMDMLLSRALNRGYAESRFAWPVAFGLLNNDCRWVFDEVQLVGPGRTTSAQLHGLREKLGVVDRCETVSRSPNLRSHRPRRSSCPPPVKDMRVISCRLLTTVRRALLSMPSARLTRKPSSGSGGT